VKAATQTRKGIGHTSGIMRFEVTPAGFQLDGRPHRILAGALHYFRVHPDHWPHRLAMLQAMGLTCVETYVPWNLHEPAPGEYTFDGIADLDRFLRLAADAGMHAIVRPGPYICAEWENGGFPSWLTGRDDVRLRCLDRPYLDAVDRWFDELVPRIADRQITRGGNVIMVQIENEYGSYGSDIGYLRHLADGLVSRGIEVPLFTSDGPEDHMLSGGTLPGVLATVNFGSDPEDAFAALARHRPDDPPMCMEFWVGWFDHWGADHVVRDPADAADTLDRILRAGASVNIYMAHGGTNFGTWAGANRSGEHRDGRLEPTVTSYDYDAPISEDGRPTDKFWQFRQVLERYHDEPLPEPPEPGPRLPASTVELAECVPLIDALEKIALEAPSSPWPRTFEELGLTHGLALYRTTLPGPRAAYPLTIDGLGDRAHVYVDGELVATLDDDTPSVDVAVPGEAVDVDLLVESMGRTNYGPRVGEGKGIAGGVRHERQYVHGFTTYALDLPELPAVPWGEASTAEPPAARPAFYRGTFTVTEPGDSWVSLPGWTKGYVWVNGFCLGRYWSRGPQRSLFLPGPLLRPGTAEIVVLELDERTVQTVEFRPDA
jgi:beta-galactosidase